MVVTEGMLAAKSGVILPHLDERQRRLVLAAEARMPGHGGIRLVARAAGVSEITVSSGVAGLEAGAAPAGRVRRPGGGRKRAADTGPGLVPALLALVEPEERGDPVSPLRWTVKPTRTLAGELTRQGHKVSAGTVRDLLHRRGVQPAGQRQDHRGNPAPGPRRPVPLHQRPGQGLPGRRGPGGQRSRREEGDDRGVRQPGPPAAAAGRPGPGP